jgi:hypothetical protein
MMVESGSLQELGPTTILQTLKISIDSVAILHVLVNHPQRITLNIAEIAGG